MIEVAAVVIRNPQGHVLTVRKKSSTKYQLPGGKPEKRDLISALESAGYRVAEVPVRWYYSHTRHVDLRRDAWRGVADLFGVASARLRGRYGPRRATPRGEGSRAEGSPIDSPRAAS